ncbi:MAG TPA: hypothetical protein PKE31_18445 [Pseudomonadota bacterium]|jgi:hypothetical protein|nr:hypothetical protein [Pseudomonadota bacterium]
MSNETQAGETKGQETTASPDAQHDPSDHHAPGTMTLTLVLLGSFVVYYFANWMALADVWHVR